MRPFHLTFAAVLLVASQLSAQGRIEITEPTEWGGIATRGLQVVRRGDLRVAGRVYHPSGIRTVRLNGKEVRVFRDPGGDAWTFTGFLPKDTAAGEWTVEVAAFPRVGEPFARQFTAELHPETPEDLLPQAAFGRVKGKRMAVIVGISQYADDGIPDLKYADADARAVYHFLTSERAGLGGFAEENVRLLTNEEATYQAIRRSLRSFLDRATPDDLVVVYLAGHGTPHRQRPDEFYFLPHDADAEDIPGTGYPMEDIEALAQRTRYRDLIVFADACHSGAIGAGNTRGVTNGINEAFRDRFASGKGGSLTLTASQAGQLSQEGRQWGGGHGVFTHYLLEGLRGQADFDSDQVVELLELVEYVRDEVKAATNWNQIPYPSGEFDNGLPMSVVPDGEGRVPPTEGVTTIILQDTVVIQDSVFIQDSVRIYAAPLPYTAGGTLARGLFVPGMGQFTSGRKGVGAAFLVAAGAAVAASLVSKTEQVQREFTDQFGNPYTQSVVETSKPYQVIGLGAAAAITVIGAIEAYVHTRAEWDEALALMEVGGDGEGTTLRLGLPEVTPRGLGGGVDLSFASIRFR